ncbi:CsbD family protein [Streptomyces sp. NPDC053493]|uniref:CsbD family protein n=1 Tax=Streptomyces sp. NPDC053493 TaxID=3365705 RepID=UPI0037D2AB7E
MRKSAMQKGKGKLKETAGKATGNERMEMEGKAEEAAGKAREGMEKAGEGMDRAAEEAAKSRDAMRRRTRGTS